MDIAVVVFERTAFDLCYISVVGSRYSPILACFFFDIEIANCLFGLGLPDLTMRFDRNANLRLVLVFVVG